VFSPVECCEETGDLGNLGVNEKIILKWILEKQVVKMRNGLNWYRIGPNGGSILSGRQTSFGA
jgi:hypothetical protein